MSNQFYVIPLRNDLKGVNIQVLDLWPNNSQKNNVLDGAGQTFYVGACLDAPGPTETKDGYYLRGSLNTLLDSDLDYRKVVDTTGGGNDAVVTPRTTFGLASYLKERVPLYNGHTLYTQYANNMAEAILNTVADGEDLTESALNDIIDNYGGDVLSGGTYYAFGSVEDILRILSGEVYVCPQNVILGDENRDFLGLSDREDLVADQIPSANGGVTYLATGRFLESTEPQFQARPKLAVTGYAKASILGGQIKKFTEKPYVVKNAAFTYGAEGTALQVDGSHIDTDGLANLFAIYDAEGVAVVGGGNGGPPPPA